MTKQEQKEKLESEVIRVRKVMEQLPQDDYSAVMIRFRLKEAEKWIWWDSQRGIEKSLRELENVK